MASTIQQFGGKFVTDGEATISGHASNLAAQWDTAVDFWWDPLHSDVDGKGGFIFFGLIQGDILFQDLEFNDDIAGTYTTLLTSDGYNEPSVAISLEYYGVAIADIFPDCYSTGIEQKAPKQVGDRLVIEGGTRYRIISDT